LTMLVGHQEEHPACKKIKGWGAAVVICLQWGANDLHTVRLMPLPRHHLLLHYKVINQNGLTFLVPVYPRVVLEKRLWNKWMSFLLSPGSTWLTRLCLCWQHFFQDWLLWMTLKATKLATKINPVCHLVHIITTLLSTKVVSLIQC